MESYERAKAKRSSLTFSPYSKEGQSALKGIAFFRRQLYLALLATLFFLYASPAFAALSVGYACFAWLSMEKIESKMIQGYPYLEPSDSTAVFMHLFYSAIATFLAFIFLLS